jgi:hypothetical protein
MEFLILLIVDIICILSLLIYLHHKNKKRNKYEI